MRSEASLRENRAMIGIRFVTDEKGGKVAVQIGLKKRRRRQSTDRDHDPCGPSA
jgi:hypothetical protein